MKSENIDSWFFNKKKIFFSVIFIILFLFSIDIWNWNKTYPLIFGMPFWIWYHCGLTISTGFIFYLFSLVFWRNE